MKHIKLYEELIGIYHNNINVGDPIILLNNSEFTKKYGFNKNGLYTVDHISTSPKTTNPYRLNGNNITQQLYFKGSDIKKATAEDIIKYNKRNTAKSYNL